MRAGAGGEPHAAVLGLGAAGAQPWLLHGGARWACRGSLDNSGSRQERMENISVF